MRDVGIVLIDAIAVFCRIMEVLIFVRIVLSWIRLPQGNRFRQLVYALTEPILGPIRALLAKSPLGGAGMPLDFSPLLAYLLLQFGSSLLIQLLVRLFFQ